jgi:multidrug efflux pump
MHGLIAAALDRSRTTLLVLLFLMLGGLAAYFAIPKEANPDVSIPIIYVSVTLEGISPEDAERLLVRPLEQELRSLEGVKEMRSMANEGQASVTLEFDAGFNAKLALADVREKVDTARSKLPEEAEEPTVNEVNVALFPVLSIGLSGPIAETELVYIARRLKENVEGIAEVLSVEIGGDREDLLEIVVDPQVLDSYGIDYNELFNLISRNNRLVAAGSLDTGAGRMSLKVPGVIEDLEDVLSMPIKVVDNSVVTFGDVATAPSRTPPVTRASTGNPLWYWRFPSAVVPTLLPPSSRSKRCWSRPSRCCRKASRSATSWTSRSRSKACSATCSTTSWPPSS